MTRPFRLTHTEYLGSASAKATADCSPTPGLRMPGRAFLYLYIVSTFMSGTPFASQVLQGASLVALAIVVIIDCAVRGRMVVFGSFEMALFAFFSYSAISVLMGGADEDGLAWAIRFGLGAILVPFLSAYGRSWCGGALAVIAACGFVHAAATIVFWAFPSLYASLYYPRFLADAGAIIGGTYKSALTLHYSINGSFLSSGFLAAFGFAFSGARHQKCAAWVAFLVLLVALVLCTKRAHLVFSLVAVAVVLLVGRQGDIRILLRRFAVFLMLFLAFISLASTVAPDLMQVFLRIEDAMGDSDFGGRSNFYAVCVGMWASSPLFGLGWGSFSSYYAGYDAHDVFLQLLAEEGLVGFVLFLWLMVAILSRSFGLLRSVPRGIPTIKAPLLCASAIQLFFFLYCFTGNPLYDAICYIPFLVSCGVTQICAAEAGLGRAACLRSPRSSGRSLRRTPRAARSPIAHRQRSS